MHNVRLVYIFAHNYWSKTLILTDTFGLVRVLPGTSTDLTELGIQMHKACVSQYTTYEKRLQTFKEWPKNLNQTPEMLAAAGFYYLGQREKL